MAEVFEEGLIGAIGVSNYNLGQTIKCVEELGISNLKLASNQLEYHLLERRIEKNGLMQYCFENGIKSNCLQPVSHGNVKRQIHT